MTHKYFSPPSPPLPTVQHECIPQAILGGDVICQAKSGMGKTAVFVLATLQQLQPVDGEVSVLVMCHARELAFQIAKEYERFSKYFPNVKTAVFFGGMAIQKDRQVLKDSTPVSWNDFFLKKKSCVVCCVLCVCDTRKLTNILRQQKHIVVGTPGRLLALAREGALKLNQVKHFILDECDRMLMEVGESLQTFLFFCFFLFLFLSFSPFVL